MHASLSPPLPALNSITPLYFDDTKRGEAWGEDRPLRLTNTQASSLVPSPRVLAF